MSKVPSVKSETQISAKGSAMSKMGKKEQSLPVFLNKAKPASNHSEMSRAEVLSRVDSRGNLSHRGKQRMSDDNKDMVSDMDDSQLNNSDIGSSIEIRSKNARIKMVKGKSGKHKIKAIAFD